MSANYQPIKKKRERVAMEEKQKVRSSGPSHILSQKSLILRNFLNKCLDICQLIN